jgi:hypothetical protein
MSVEASSAVWKHSRQKSGPLLVLLAIADYINTEGNAWPAVSTLARKVRMSKRNTQRCLRVLKEAGELEIRPNQGRRGSNIYRLRLFNVDPNNSDTRVIRDAAVAHPVSCASSSDDTGVTQSVIKPSKESAPVVPTGDEIAFWTQVCFDCFEQSPHPLPSHVSRALARSISRLDKKNADSLRKFYKYKELNSKEPPYNSRRHSPERLMLDLPRQLGLAVQEYRPPPPPTPPKEYPFTLEELHDYLREKYGNCRLPRSLGELDAEYWPRMLPEIYEAFRMRNENNRPQNDAP